jgi:hypothetical protein
LLMAATDCIIKMYFVMYTMSLMLILRVLIRYRPVSTSEFARDIRSSKIFYTDDEKVSKLNALWNMYPNDYNSLIFMHSFDGITNASNFGYWKGYCDDKSSWPWCIFGHNLYTYNILLKRKLKLRGGSHRKTQTSRWES